MARIDPVTFRPTRCWCSRSAWSARSSGRNCLTGGAPRRRELAHDVAGGPHVVDAGDAFSRLPVLAVAAGLRETGLQAAHGIERVQSAHPVLRLVPPEHPAGERAGLRSEAANVVV